MKHWKGWTLQMNKGELIAAVSEKSGLSKKDAGIAVNGIMESIHWVKGEETGSVDIW